METPRNIHGPDSDTGQLITLLPYAFGVAYPSYLLDLTETIGSV